MNSIKNVYKSKSAQPKVSSAFTLIEMLVVIVVIGILVAISVVGYNAVVKSSRESALKSELEQAYTDMELSYVDNMTYLTDASELKKSADTTFNLISYGDEYCLSGSTAKAGPFYVNSNTKNPQSGTCPPSTVMQGFTAAQCQALPIYDGTNDSALRTLTDNRDGTTRSYRIAKLADNKCWMLDNLKLGKTTGTTTLTPANTNIATNFTLPQLITTGTASYDIPQATGPVPGDTGNGATNYGYLYNWPAATAGETRTTMPGGSGNAQYSICPKNWRLPTGGYNADRSNTVGDFPDLDRAFGGTGQYAESGEANIAKWQNTGPFKGVFSGGWGGSFDVQGSYGSWWSSSASPGDSDVAFDAYVSPDGVGPGEDGDGRGGGFGVRCLLN